MIFQHTYKQVLDGTKTQTRRLVKPGHKAWDFISDGRWGQVRRDTPSGHFLMWETGKTYAVQPGRTKKAVGRIRITGIRRERLQDITQSDVVAEGIGQYTFARGALSENPPDPRWKFIELWNSIHTKPGTRWEDNPEVWVLEFEVVA